LLTFPKNLFPEKRAFQRFLLRWYASHKRDLPWRKNADPYRVMVSEFMLQQTRVETVLPYYERFLKTFPTLQSLARASLQSVLKIWAGMGYYARARHLHAAARAILYRHAGMIPRTKEELLSLPGFGPYIAGAVASIAFHEPVAALDGNVNRIVSRVLGLREEISTSRQKKMLENSVGELIPSRQASAFNQALMDLGALVCIPKQPRCPQCPVKTLCSWRTTDRSAPSPLAGEGEGGGDFGRSSFVRIEERNKKRRVRKIRKEVWAVALIEQDGRYLIHRKEGKGLLAGLWQFPIVALEENISREARQERKIIRDALRGNFGLRLKIKGELPIKEHQFTHLHVTMKPFQCSLAETISADKVPRDLRWVKPSHLSRYPISRAMGKIAALIHYPSASPP
jgi:A/G-specific adenine glycosylase